MGIVFLFLGYLFGGIRGAVLVSGAGLFLLWFSPRIAPSVIMGLYGARSLQRGEISRIHEIVHLLARRASLSRVPRLYYVPTRLMNAFTVGDRENSAIGLTDGLLRALNLRELAGVLAHPRLAGSGNSGRRRFRDPSQLGSRRHGRAYRAWPRYPRLAGRKRLVSADTTGSILGSLRAWAATAQRQRTSSRGGLAARRYRDPC